MEKPIEFGTYIHDLRKEKKYSLKIVADKLGCNLLKHYKTKKPLKDNGFEGIETM